MAPRLPKMKASKAKKKRTHTLHRELKGKIARIQSEPEARAEAVRALAECSRILNTPYVPKRRKK